MKKFGKIFPDPCICTGFYCFLSRFIKRMDRFCVLRRYSTSLQFNAFTLTQLCCLIVILDNTLYICIWIKFVSKVFLTDIHKYLHYP